MFELEHAHTGVVKWFNDIKGFGFITSDTDGKDRYVHHTAIISDGFRTLKQGQRVTFNPYDEKSTGLECINVKVIKDDHQQTECL
jgi:CspA family cold shock protein